MFSRASLFEFDLSITSKSEFGGRSYCQILPDLRHYLHIAVMDRSHSYSYSMYTNICASPKDMFHPVELLRFV